MKYIKLIALSIIAFTLASCAPKTQSAENTNTNEPLNHTNTTDINTENQPNPVENTNTNEPLNHTNATDINTENQPNPVENTNTKDKNDTSPLPSVGSIITFGNYEQDNDTTNGKEPIEWRVLEIDGVNHKMLLLSEYVLDAQPYHDERPHPDDDTWIIRAMQTSITWANSSLRTWLNNTFITTAFSATEQAKIQTTHLDNPDNPFFGTAGGVATDDKVFLLGLDDVYGEDSHYSAGNWYFNNNDDRIARTTRYAEKQGVFSVEQDSAYTFEPGAPRIDFNDVKFCYETNYQVDKCLASWWLRSPGYKTCNAALVRPSGSIFDNGDSVWSKNYGVRPALWVNY